MRSESGLINLIVAAIALPLIFLLTAAAFDYSRIPLTKQLIEDSLYKNLINLEPNWECGVAGPDPKAELGGSPTVGNDSTGCNPIFGVEPFQLYNHNFCFLTNPSSTKNLSFSDPTFCKGISLGTTGSTDRSQILKGQSPGYLMSKAAESLLDTLTKVGPSQSSSWLYKVDPQDLKISYGIFRVKVDIDGNSPALECPFLTWVGESGNLTPDSTEKILSLTTSPSACDMITSNYGTLSIDDKKQGSRIEPCGVDTVNCKPLYLPSFWIVGVANIRIHSYFGGLAWPGDAHGKGSYIVNSYIIKPLTSIAGIEPTT